MGRVAPVAAAAIANESSRPNPAGGERQLSGLTAVGLLPLRLGLIGSNQAAAL